MLTREEDIDVHALRKRGWTISAIARHLRRDRKTIRAYLAGREPGVRQETRRPAERTESGCAMTALRPPRRGACRAVSFTSASASLAPTVGQRATPVHDRAGAQDRTQLLPQEEQR